MPTLAEEIEVCRRNFISWLRWYADANTDEIPNRYALAKKLGITRSAVTQLLKADGKRAPNFKTLLGLRRLTGMPVDALLGKPPRFR